MAGEDFTDADIDRAQARLAHITGICPRCGDDGWWIDNNGKHFCDCPAGQTARAALTQSPPEAAQ